MQGCCHIYIEKSQSGLHILTALADVSCEFVSIDDEARAILEPFRGDFALGELLDRFDNAPSVSHQTFSGSIPAAYNTSRELRSEQLVRGEAFFHRVLVSWRI